MNRLAAMRIVDGILKNNFKYLFKKQTIDFHTLHLTFKMDSINQNLQMSFDFQESWCDILCFISPTIRISCCDIYWEVLQTINYINWNIKSWGGYYIDTYGDLAYSLRLDFDVLEKIPHKCTKEIECAIEYYADLFVPFINICQGKILFVDTKQFIDDMWGGIQ